MQKEKTGLVLGKKNIIYLAAGLLIVIIGFIMMSGGEAPNEDYFEASEIFSDRRITYAPITVLIGYALVGIGIMIKPDQTLADSENNYKN